MHRVLHHCHPNRWRRRALIDDHLGRAAVGALALTAVSSFLPWIVAGEISEIGVDTGDGRICSVVALAGIGLVLRGIRAAWIAAGFCLVIALRASATISDASGVTVGIGVWAAALTAAIAAGLLIVRYLSQIREEAAAG